MSKFIRTGVSKNAQNVEWVFSILWVFLTFYCHFSYRFLAPLYGTPETSILGSSVMPRFRLKTKYKIFKTTKIQYKISKRFIRSVFFLFFCLLLLLDPGSFRAKVGGVWREDLLLFGLFALADKNIKTNVENYKLFQAKFNKP